MTGNLSASEKKIGQIFSNDYEFRIPGYQRPYAWTPQQAGELLDDLLSFLREQKSVVKEMSPYFLGSIVLIKRDGAPQADVVDGQQRLTTLTLLLAALRAHLPCERADEVKSFIYQAGSVISGTEETFRLLVRERDRNFFREYVQLPGGFQKLVINSDRLSDSRANLRDNACHFDERLQTLSKAELTNLALFIVTRCFLVVVSTADLDSAYRIFAVMNSRGLDLSATDILKARVIGSIPESDRGAYTSRWEAIEEDLGRDRFSDLFGHIRMIHRKSKSQGTLLREFQEHVCNEREPKAVIDDVIVPYATTYRILTDADYASPTGAEPVNRSLRWLSRLEFSDWMPPALAFATIHRNNSGLMQRFFADMERLAYAMLVLKQGINERIERFSRLTAEIEAGADLSEDSNALQLSPEECTKVVEMLDGPVYETLAARARSTLLLRLDDLISGGGATYDYPVITVEHVLPQNPSADSQWVKWFPDAETRPLWTQRLGNLALLTRRKNSAASNYDFDRKKSAYFTKGGVSPFPLTTQVLQHERWTPDVLEQRQAELLAAFREHWRLGN